MSSPHKRSPVGRSSEQGSSFTLVDTSEVVRQSFEALEVQNQDLKVVENNYAQHSPVANYDKFKLQRGQRNQKSQKKITKSRQYLEEVKNETNAQFLSRKEELLQEERDKNGTLPSIQRNNAQTSAKASSNGPERYLVRSKRPAPFMAQSMLGTLQKSKNTSLSRRESSRGSSAVKDTQESAFFGQPSPSATNKSRTTNNANERIAILASSRQVDPEIAVYKELPELNYHGNERSPPSASSPSPQELKGIFQETLVSRLQPNPVQKNTSTRGQQTALNRIELSGIANSRNDLSQMNLKRESWKLL